MDTLRELICGFAFFRHYYTSIFANVQRGNEPRSLIR